jgi:hypothetical protein
MQAAKRKRGITPNGNPANLTAPRWLPGQSGNPKGRPKGQPILRDAFVRILRSHARTKLKPRTKLDALALRIVEDAIAGEAYAANALLERLDPKVNWHEVSGRDGNAVQVNSFFDLWEAAKGARHERRTNGSGDSVHGNGGAMDGGGDGGRDEA